MSPGIFYVSDEAYLNRSLIIILTSETEYQCEDIRKEDQTDAETCALTERLSESVHGYERYDLAEERNEQKQELYTVGIAVYDLEQNILAVERDDRSPAGLACFFEDLPLCDDKKNHQSDKDEEQDYTRACENGKNAFSSHEKHSFQQLLLTKIFAFLL